jgi:hypothetical protein
MTDTADALDKLLFDVRKTISDNKQFLEKLVDETVVDDPDDAPEVAVAEEDYVEL